MRRSTSLVRWSGGEICNHSHDLLFTQRRKKTGSPCSYCVLTHNTVYTQRWMQLLEWRYRYHWPRFQNIIECASIFLFLKEFVIFISIRHFFPLCNFLHWVTNLLEGSWRWRRRRRRGSFFCSSSTRTTMTARLQQWIRLQSSTQCKYYAGFTILLERFFFCVLCCECFNALLWPTVW